MDLLKFVEYGVAALAVGGLIYIAIQHISIIRNDIKHSADAIRENGVAFQKLSSSIDQMLRFLERRNGGK